MGAQINMATLVTSSNFADLWRWLMSMHIHSMLEDESLLAGAAITVAEAAPCFFSE